MNKTMLSFALLFIAADLLAGAAPSATVTLELPFPRILPGVPFDLTLHYKNSSDRTITLSKRATVIITPVGGDPVRLPHVATVEDLYGLPYPRFVLHPGEEAVGTLSWSQDFLSDDAAFAGPGSYDVALELEASGDDEDENAVGVGPIRTSAARLTRIEPRGEDSEVWHRLLEASDSKWPSNGLLKKTLADEVIAKHKNSGYCPYALVLGRYPWMTPLADLRDAADRFHDSPAYPHLLVTVAIAAGSEAGRARNRDASLDEVERYLKLAKFYDEEALRTGIPAVHAHAAQLKRVDDDELERIREQRRRIK